MQQSVVHLGSQWFNTVSSLGEKNLSKGHLHFSTVFFGYRRDLFMYLSFFDSQLELLDA